MRGCGFHLDSLLEPNGLISGRCTMAYHLKALTGAVVAGTLCLTGWKYVNNHKSVSKTIISLQSINSLFKGYLGGQVIGLRYTNEAS